MKQIESFAIENPCQQRCRFNRQRYCLTCMRHMDERIAWDELSDEDKRGVLRKCYQRKVVYKRAQYKYSQEQLRQQRRIQARPQEQLNLFDAPDQHNTGDGDHNKHTADDTNPQLPLF